MLTISRRDPQDTLDVTAVAVAETTRRPRRWRAVMVAMILIGTGGSVFVFRGAGLGHRAAPVLNRPEALAVATDGSLLIANDGTNQILRRSPDGRLTVVAGTGRAGYSGDGGPAIDAQLDEPGGMAVAANGTIYVADTANNCVRAIALDGTITTVAMVPQPDAVALGPDGRRYVVDSAGVQRITADGTPSTVIGAGPGRIDLNGTPTALFPDAVAIDGTGDVFVADSSPKLLIEFSPSGQVLHTWSRYVTPAGLSAAPDGSVLVGDYGFFAVDRVRDGRLAPVATFARDSLATVPGVFRPSGVAVAATGEVYADTDGVNGGTNRPAVVVVTAPGQIRLLTTSPR